MPHIHTEPNQHDVTVSAYIVRFDNDEPLAFVHMHRKFGKLLQVGGHIELDETPWQAVAHELREESGYGLDELQVLQPSSQLVEAVGAIMHPLPIFSNTHTIPNMDSHFHSDFAYAFVAGASPKHSPAEGESDDVRWLTLKELKRAAHDGVAARDIAVFYEAIITKVIGTYVLIPASRYSLEKPSGLSI